MYEKKKNLAFKNYQLPKKVIFSELLVKVVQFPDFRQNNTLFLEKKGQF